MKAIIAIIIFITLFTTYCYGISEKDFIGAKAQLLYAYKTLETDALQISLIYEQEAAEMSQKEQALCHIIRGDLELGMFVVKEVLGLYTLQGVQESTPPEAIKLLTDASLDALDFLNRLEERLKVRVADVSNAMIKNIVAESLSTIDMAKKAIATMQGFTENLM